MVCRLSLWNISYRRYYVGRMTQKSLIKPMPSLPSGVDRRAYESDTARPLKPELLSIALALPIAFRVRLMTRRITNRGQRPFMVRWVWLACPLASMPRK